MGMSFSSSALHHADMRHSDRTATAEYQPHALGHAQWPTEVKSNVMEREIGTSAVGMAKVAAFQPIARSNGDQAVEVRGCVLKREPYQLKNSPSTSCTGVPGRIMLISAMCFSLKG
jgi:hypothetical protein